MNGRRRKRHLPVRRAPRPRPPGAQQAPDRPSPRGM